MTGARRAGALALVLALAASPLTAEAQASALVIVGEESPRALAWRRRLERPDGTTLRAFAERVAPVDTVAPEDLRVFAQIEALLMAARRSAARLEERDALRALAGAERLAAQHLAVPGVAAWYAEVELAIAVTSSQAGMTRLADAALRRAASVDPERTVQAAEARPELVAQSREIARAVATRPRGRFMLRADAPGARAFLDDRPLGALPRAAEAPVGQHVLRVEAPGHRAYARIIDVLEGERAPVVVSLAPSEALLAARRAEAAARAGEVEALARALSAMRAQDPPQVEVLWVGEGPLDRAVRVRCDAAGCDPPARLEPGGAIGAAASLADALRWLEESPLPIADAEPPWWERWYVWAGAGAVIAAAVAAIVALAQPQGPAPLVIDIDTRGLPRR